MGLFERRHTEDLDEIRRRVTLAARHVQTAVDRAVQGLLDRDKDLCWQVILEDRPINRELRELDALCHAFVARHRPDADQRRLPGSVLRLSLRLERIGDYAVTVARNAVQLSQAPPRKMVADIELIAEQASRMLATAIEAWSDGNADQARATARMARNVDRTFEQVYADLLRKKSKRPLKDLFMLLGIFISLERVSDQAKNVCEETIFVVDGEPKRRKKFRILFVDRANDRTSQLVEAYIRKAFPDAGWYASLGWEPAAEVAPEAMQLARERSLDMGGAIPQPLSDEIERIGRFDIIVGLEPGALELLEPMPYHTVFLDWSGEEESGFEGRWLELTGKVRNLMAVIRGPGPD